MWRLELRIALVLERYPVIPDFCTFWLNFEDRLNISFNAEVKTLKEWSGKNYHSWWAGVLFLRRDNVLCDWRFIITMTVRKSFHRLKYT